MTYIFGRDVRNELLKRVVVKYLFVLFTLCFYNQSQAKQYTYTVSYLM